MNCHIPQCRSGLFDASQASLRLLRLLHLPALPKTLRKCRRIARFRPVNLPRCCSLSSTLSEYFDELSLYTGFMSGTKPARYHLSPTMNMWRLERAKRQKRRVSRKLHLRTQAKAIQGYSGIDLPTAPVSPREVSDPGRISFYKSPSVLGPLSNRSKPSTLARRTARKL